MSDCSNPDSALIPSEPPRAERIRGRFSLSTISATRRTFARVVRAFAKGELDPLSYRLLVYGLSAYVKCSEVEKEINDFEERLRALEERQNA